MKRQIKIISHLNTGLQIDSAGKPSYSFRNRLYDEDEKFRSKVIIPINEVVVFNNWAIDFIENPGVGFIVDVFSNPDDFHKIKKIVLERIPDIDFEFFHKGDI